MWSVDCWGGWQALFIYISYDFYRLFSLDLRWSELASVHKLLTVDVSYNAMDEDELTQLTKSYCRPRVKLCLEGTRMPKTYWPIFFGEHGHTSEQANKKVFSWKETKYHEIDWNKMIYQKIQAETIHYHHFLEHCWHLLTKQLVKQWSMSFALLWLEAIIT